MYNHQVGIFLASGGKLENKVFKLLIGGSTASDACSMQEDKIHE
jgi:hypothetical protein